MSLRRSWSASSAPARIAASAVGAIVVIALTACAGPSTTETFYALSAGPGGAVTSTAARDPDSPAIPGPDRPGIVVSAVSVPELVDRPQIVTRDQANRVVVAEQHLWAESVRAGIARTLALRLSRTLAEAGRPAQVATYPQTSIARPTLRVTVDVVRFDAHPNGEAVVEALWSVRRVADENVRTGRTIAASPVAGASYEAIVQAWNEALIVLDRDIATTVLQVLPSPNAS